MMRYDPCKSKFPMARPARFVALLGLNLIALTGCAWVPRNGGFEGVKRTAAERIGHDIVKRDGTDQDQKLDEQIKAMLQEELTAESAVKIALLNNHKLQAVYADLGIAQADLVQAGLLPNPVFDGSYKNTIRGDEEPEFEFTLVDEFIGILTLPLRKRIAEAEFESAKLRVTQEVLALAAETKGQFHVVQADEQMLEMLQQVVAATGASVDAAQRLFDAGNIRDLDLDNEKSLHAQARLDLAAAEVATRKNRERLNILMGLWGSGVETKIPSRLPDVPGEELMGNEIEKRVVEKNVELEMLRQEILARGRALGLTRATALIPELSLGIDYSDAGASRQAGPAFGFPIPLFDQGQPRVANAKAELRKAQEMFYYKAVEVRASARAAWDHLQIARQRALYSRDVALPLQHRILSATQLEYNAMQVGVFQLLLAKKEEIETGKAYIEDLRDYWLARAELESLLAGHVTATGLETTALDSVMGSALH